MPPSVPYQQTIGKVARGGSSRTAGVTLSTNHRSGGLGACPVVGEVFTGSLDNAAAAAAAATARRRGHAQTRCVLHTHVLRVFASASRGRPRRGHSQAGSDVRYARDVAHRPGATRSSEDQGPPAPQVTRRRDLFRRAAGSASELTTAPRIARARGFITPSDFAAVDSTPRSTGSTPCCGRLTHWEGGFGLSPFDGRSWGSTRTTTASKLRFSRQQIGGRIVLIAV